MDSGTAHNRASNNKSGFHPTRLNSSCARNAAILNPVKMKTAYH